ncbi:hypothetical protein PV350_23525 [Streptomyces sp. PA03-6a]|nr:hypothetical protein [Streptomyces sp. PA03-6a]
MPDNDLAIELEKLRTAMLTGFARLEGQIEALTKNVTSADSDVKKLEERVSALEKKVYAAAGIAALVGAFVPDSVMRALGA